MWLTLGTFIGSPWSTRPAQAMDPQNIVIGEPRAMPPVLGWAAVTGEVAPEALLLFLIISRGPRAFLGARALSHRGFRQAGLPMLPVTHGHRFTRLYVLLTP